MHFERSLNKQLILMTFFIYLIFIFNSIAGYLTSKNTLVPLYVTVILFLINSIAILIAYKGNKTSRSIRYISFSGLFINHLFLVVTSEISLVNFIVFIMLLGISLMLLDRTLILLTLAAALFIHEVFAIIKRPDNISLVELLLNLLALLGFIWAIYNISRVYGILTRLLKINAEGRTGNYKNIGNIADYLYEKVTRLESETEMLKKGGNEFRLSLKDVAKAVEDIAGGSSSIIEDTKKIAINVAELERALSDNREHINCVTENMERIIDNKNQGLDLMNELKNSTETMLNAVAEINKMVNETRDNTDKIVSAGEFIKHIASQTNILALNAAIEASQTGRSNNGFSVIAEEIRSLSVETNKYVKEIQDYTTLLAESVVNAVKALEKANSAIENEIRNVKSMDDLLERIHESITSTQDYIVKLNESEDVILQQAKEIKESISSLYAVNEENHANMNRELSRILCLIKVT